MTITYHAVLVTHPAIPPDSDGKCPTAFRVLGTYSTVEEAETVLANNDLYTGPAIGAPFSYNSQLGVMRGRWENGGSGPQWWEIIRHYRTQDQFCDELVMRHADMLRIMLREGEPPPPSLALTAPQSPAKP